MIVRHGKYFLNSRIDNLFTSVAFDSVRNVRVERTFERWTRKEKKEKQKAAVVFGLYHRALLKLAPVCTNTDIHEGIREFHREYTWMHSSLGVHADYP